MAQVTSGRRLSRIQSTRWYLPSTQKTGLHIHERGKPFILSMRLRCNTAIIPVYLISWWITEMPYANNGNIKLHYQVEGSGPPLILAHGFMMDTTCWYDFGYVEQFKSRHTLLILDARGHGKSDKPLETDSYLTLIHICRCRRAI